MSNILVIEDDKFLRELIARKLISEKFETVTAVDGETGLKKAEQTKPDLILLDLILPGIDGFEVLAKLKANKDLSDIPVIILSNLGQQEDVDKGLEIGAIDYLIKAHFTPNEIVDKIRKAMATGK